MLCFITLRQETILSILQCVKSLVQCYSQRRLQLDCRLVESIHPVLKKIWATTLRVVGIKQLTDSGFSLLTILLKVYNSVNSEDRNPFLPCKGIRHITFWSVEYFMISHQFYLQEYGNPPDPEMFGAILGSGSPSRQKCRGVSEICIQSDWNHFSEKAMPPTVFKVL